MNVSCDVVVVGAGVCGLWARHELSRAGLRVVTIERSAMGDGQTVASQGILHRGVKYAVSHSAREASEVLQRVHARWMDAMAGRGGPDLGCVRILAQRTHMWSTPSMLGGVVAEAASRVMVSGVRRLEEGELPPAFRGAPRGVRVWEIDESVVDPRSLLAELARAGEGPIVRAPSIVMKSDADRVHVEMGGGAVLIARRVVLCAGAGNEELLGSLGMDGPSIMQRRPLHMAVACGAPSPVYGHCLQASLSDKPRLTVTSTPEAGGTWTWYLGGNLAEKGVERDEASQIATAREEVRACLAWIDTSGLHFETLRIDRAEGRTPAGTRPDTPVVRAFGPVIVAWPTKLALTPVAADEIVRCVREALGARDPIDNAAWSDACAALQDRAPGVAPLPWETHA
ncbi:MAG: FAD-dependent oxidoreductase [Phycisphaerales bacterium]|nr:FAD-dependent oxidoreductase [Phycisphaerales bacterium]